MALFATCLVDTFYPDTGKAVVSLLTRLGCRVEFPFEQTCCGQLHFNAGYPEVARSLAERYEEIFAGFDAVVMPSGSCAGMVRDIYPRLPVSARARTYELSEFLVDVLGVTDVGAYFPHTVTYHPTCHSLRVLGLGDRPLRLLQAVEGLDLRELPGAEECCGFGGMFAVKNSAVSSAMLADKIDAVSGTGAAVLSAADNSCLMHIGGGMSRLKLGTRPLHLAQILASTRELTW
ncbi:(Fe-S)-binding protein [Pseudonocardiaceae bacterium YIM PH 21723]|nr:(Fe-S)-binding protein [Pseudonocardiaceae bacterium YIM PH 21723]